MKIETILKTAQLEKFDWVKVVEGLDKSQRGGYSIIGNFTKDTDLKNGLYLGVDKGSYDYYCLFKITNDKVEIIKIFENDKKSWARQFWSEIEENLDQTLAEKLFNEVVDTTTNLDDLRELRDLLNKKIKEKAREHGEYDFTFEEVFNPIPVPEFRVDEVKKIYEEKNLKLDDLTNNKKKEQILIYSIAAIEMKSDFESLLKFNADIKTYPNDMFWDAFKDFKNEPEVLIYKGKACFYLIDTVEKTIKIRFSD